jgi:membrane-associated phospholipid phosphatase
LRSSDWVALLYFLYLAGVCWLRPLPAWRRLYVTAISLATAGLVLASRGVSPAVHNWVPLVYIGVGYYLTGRLFVAPSEALESWLLAWDRRLLGDPTTRFARWPAPLVAYLDIVYTFTFVLLPAGFGVLAATGRSALADHYWTLVLAADLGAFAPLSVFQTRPPWILERAPDLPARSVHRMASFMVRHATIRVNTFPSGHVAVSLAVAFAIAGVMPAVGALMLILAISIAIACVVGRYHYAMDVVAGVALAGVVWAVTHLCGV